MYERNFLVLWNFLQTEFMGIKISFNINQMSLPMHIAEVIELPTFQREGLI